MKSESDFEYDSFKIRTRYRIGEKNRYLLGPLIYIEYIRDDDFSAPNVIEAKLILAKDIGDFNIAYNQIIKQEAESDGLAEYEYAFGMNYKLNSRFRVGIESKGNYTENKYSLGPTLSFVMGKNWLSLGAVYGLNSRSDELQMRLIFGILF